MRSRRICSMSRRLGPLPLSLWLDAMPEVDTVLRGVKDRGDGLAGAQATIFDVAPADQPVDVGQDVNAGIEVEHHAQFLAGHAWPADNRVEAQHVAGRDLLAVHLLETHQKVDCWGNYEVTHRINPCLFLKPRQAHSACSG